MDHTAETQMQLVGIRRIDAEISNFTEARAKPVIGGTPRDAAVVASLDAAPKARRVDDARIGWAEDGFSEGTRRVEIGPGCSKADRSPSKSLRHRY